MHLIAPIAETRLKEVVDYFAHLGLKDQRAFGATAVKKAELRRSLNQILDKEVLDANIGLGILATYENNLDKALEHFKIAYNFSNKDSTSSLNYANSLFVSGRHKEAFPIYKNAIIKESTSLDIFQGICRALIGYGYLDELEDISKCLKGIENPYSARYQREINLMRNTLSYLESINVSVDLFRSYHIAIDKIFFKYFNITTTFDTEVFHDRDRSTFSYLIYLPVSKSDKNIEDLVGDMNDELQDEIIKLRKTDDVENKEIIREMSKKLCFYFSLPRCLDVEGGNGF